MEAGCKGHHEDEDDKEDFDKGLKDVLKKKDVLSNNRQHPHVEEKVEPSQSNTNSTDLPLTAGSYVNSEVVSSVFCNIGKVVDGTVESKAIDDKIKNRSKPEGFHYVDKAAPKRSSFLQTLRTLSGPCSCQSSQKSEPAHDEKGPTQEIIPDSVFFNKPCQL